MILNCWFITCFTITSMLETFCFLMGNNLFLSKKQNVSLLETVREQYYE